MPLAVTLLLPLALFLSLVLTPVVRAIARRRGMLDSAGAAGHAKQLRSIPNVGGIAIVLSIVAPMVAALVVLATPLADSIVSALPALAEHLPGVREQTPLALGLAAALVLLHLLGLADDRRALPAIPKLLAMLAIAGAIVLIFDVRLLRLIDPWVGGAWLSILLTVLWLVAVTNALNFMDNMDGLAGGVGAIAGTMFLIAAVVNGQWFIAAVLALLVGSLAGFLVYNLPPATIFMGDGGSLPVGFLLGFLTVQTTYYAGELESPWYALFMPLCVLAVPLYDLVSVSAIRIAQGKSPLVGDQQHFSHRMRARGLSTIQTLAVIDGCVAITGIAGILLGEVGAWQAALVGTQVVLVLCLIGLFEYASRDRRRVES